MLLMVFLATVTMVAGSIIVNKGVNSTYTDSLVSKVPIEYLESIDYIYFLDKPKFFVSNGELITGYCGLYSHNIYGESVIVVVLNCTQSSTKNINDLFVLYHELGHSVYGSSERLADYFAFSKLRLRMNEYKE